MPGQHPSRVLAVVPTYNEASNILDLITRVRAAVTGVHVLVVDDDSPDGTGDLVRAHPAFGAEVHLLVRTGPRGLGNAYRDGYAWAAEHGYAVVLQLDADLSHPPESLPDLIAALDEADIAVGSRYVPGGRTEGWPLKRRLISRGAGLYARTMLGLATHDPTSGFKAYRIGALATIEVSTTATTGYGFQVECIWRATRRGLRILEVPIVFTDRVAGSSKMTLGVALEAARRILRWRLGEVRHPASIMIGLAVLATFAVHLLYVGGPLLPDEGGFAMVARWWSGGGGHLYGAQWVDRPPGLIAVFWLANHIGLDGVRLVAAILASAFVAAAAWAGWAVRGTAAASWAAWAAFFLISTPLTGAFALNGELIAAAWTMLSIAAVIHAVRRTDSGPRASLLGAIAGAAASMAVLTKQNFLDAAAFLVVFCIAEAVVVRSRRRRLVRVGGAALVGALVPVGLVAAWTLAHGTLEGLIYALYGFRVDASRVIASWSHAAPDRRMWQLVQIAVGSGIAALAVSLVVAGRRSATVRSPLFLACAAAATIELSGVVLGGNYWPHYLIGLAPTLSLAAGVLAVQGGGDPTRVVRALVIVPVVVTLGISPAVAQQVTAESTVRTTARWLASAAASGDTVTVLYSHANLIEESGLRPAYPYAWSLPIRTLDPDLALMERTLEDPQRAPDWVVGWDPIDAWGLDSEHRIDGALATRYVAIATVCGHQVWLRRGLDRELPPAACTR